jgi:hypothetical protein
MDMAEMVRAVAEQHHDDVEAMCEAMLVDPCGWGVLVENCHDVRPRVTLSPDVPFGQVHYHPGRVI